MNIWNNIYNKKRALVAFTLAEVLITLGIIGVVAAMTIPTLMNNTEKKDTVVKVKKIYSVLSQATEQISNDCGGSLTYCLTYPSATDNDGYERNEVANLYKAKLSTIKDCPDGTAGCFASSTAKYLNGDDWYTIAEWIFSGIILSDGTSIAFDWNGATNNVFNIVVDINGLKDPNQFGKDLFWFYYDGSTNLVQPSANNDCSTGGGGWGCASKILKEDKIDYY